MLLARATIDCKTSIGLQSAGSQKEREAAANQKKDRSGGSRKMRQNMG